MACDEWASDALRTATWRWIVDACPATLGQVVEIGPGAGKYTDLVLRFTAAHVTAYEISDAFITCLEQRYAGFVTDERLLVRRIDWTDNEGLLRSDGGRRDIDHVLVIDVLMMMDFNRRWSISCPPRPDACWRPSPTRAARAASPG